MSKAKHTQQPDSIEDFVRAWKRERPDLDPWPLGIHGRIQRLSTQLQRMAVEQWLAPMGLTWESFSLILALRRSGKPFKLRPTDIYRESLLTSGAITNRIDRVEKLGFVQRIPDSQDRRAVIIRLTPSGRALADRAIELHFQKLEKIFGCLTKTESRQLTALLAKLLSNVEQI